MRGGGGGVAERVSGVFIWEWGMLKEEDRLGVFFGLYWDLFIVRFFFF